MSKQAPPPTYYYKVNVIGASTVGKSSVVKRLVCHRFDNLPTKNSQFMGQQQAAQHVVRVNIPETLSKKVQNCVDAREVLLELQDRLAHIPPEKMLGERTWYEYAREAAAAAAAPSAADSHVWFGSDASERASAPHTPADSLATPVAEEEVALEEGDDGVAPVRRRGARP